MFSQASGEGSSVDATNADDSRGRQILVEGSLSPKVGDDARWVANHKTGDPDASGLGILVVHPGVADVRCGHDDDLSRVARVGDGLLVAAHAGREHALTEGLTGAAVSAAGETGAVFENENCGHDAPVVGVVRVMSAVCSAAASSGLAARK